MKHLYLFALSMLILISSDAFAQKFDWADVVFLAGRTEEAMDNEIYMTTDPSDNMYVVGKFKGEVVVTSKHRDEDDQSIVTSAPIESKGGFDVFLAKFDRHGILDWAMPIGGAGEDIGKAIACNSSGDVVITGQFEGTVDFGGTSLTSSRKNNIFLAVYNGEGELKWAKRAGGVTAQPVVEVGTGIAIDDADNIFLTGTFFGGDDQGDYSKPGVATFGDFKVENAVQATNSFAAKLTSDGEVMWVQTIGHYGLGSARSIAVDAEGNSYITGTCSATFVFNNAALNSNGLTDAYVAKFNADGSYGWFKQFGTGTKFNPVEAAKYKDPFESGTGISVDETGDLYVTGQFMDKAMFGSTELKAKEFGNIFLMRMTGDGEVKWAVKTGSKYLDVSSAVGLDGKGSVYILGINSEYGGMDWESRGGWRTATVRGVGFIEKYDVQTGKKTWGAGAGSWGLSMATDSQHNVYMVGSFANQVKFGKKKLDIKGKMKKVKSSGGGFLGTTRRNVKTYEAGFGLYMVKITE